VRPVQIHEGNPWYNSYEVAYLNALIQIFYFPFTIQYFSEHHPLSHFKHTAIIVSHFHLLQIIPNRLMLWFLICTSCWSWRQHFYPLLFSLKVLAPFLYKKLCPSINKQVSIDWEGHYWVFIWSSAWGAVHSENNLHWGNVHVHSKFDCTCSQFCIYGYLCRWHTRILDS